MTEKISKEMSYLLRHGAKSKGLYMDEGGWCLLSDLAWYAWTDEPTVRKIVKSCPKKRFEIQKFEYEGQQTEFIRATQGHTIKLNEKELLKELTEQDLPDFVIHGTYRKSISDIKASGLSKMQRQHIHMSRNLPGRNGVISGMRSSCDVIVKIDVKEAIKYGIKFYESSNGVILSPGNDQGVIPPQFLSYQDR